MGDEIDRPETHGLGVGPHKVHTRFVICVACRNFGEQDNPRLLASILIQRPPSNQDYGFLTVLMQDDVGGLQVQTADGEWIVSIDSVSRVAFFIVLPYPTQQTPPCFSLPRTRFLSPIHSSSTLVRLSSA